ncbi:MAG: type II toxin-antitoxin system HicA family toxin [bacterium]|nr:type II toxin-antitoxin system HicA family toxin [bacterium]
MVIVPHHPRDIKRGTLHSIIKQTGLAVGEFLELL